MREGPSTSLYVLLIFSMFLFGGSWVSGKLLSDRAAPELLVFLRFSFAALLMVPVLVFSREVGAGRAHRLDRQVLYSFPGALLMVGYNVCFFLGLERGSAGLGGVLVTTLNPVLTFVLSSAVFRHRTYRLQKLGIFLGLAGGAVILEVWNLSLESLVRSGNLFFLGATACWSTMTIWSQKAQRNTGHYTYSTLVYLFTALLAIPILLLRTRTIVDIPSGDPVFWGSLVFLAAGTTAVGTTIYFIAARKIGGSRAASFIFTVPLSALLLSRLLLGEIPKLSTLLGGTVSVFAVFFVNAAFSTKRKKSRSLDKERPVNQ